MRAMIPPSSDRAGAAAAAARFAATAVPDVSYAVIDLPVGRVVAARTARGLVRIAYDDLNGGIDQILQRLADRLSPRILEAPGRLEDVQRELERYFAGDLRRFTVPLDWALVGGFATSVLRATAAIPYGEVSTYGAISTAVGRPGASRAAGNALGSNPIPIVIPCHRVLRSGGGLGGYTGGLHRKQALLAVEAAGRGSP